MTIATTATRDLEALLDAVESGRVHAPLSGLTAQRLGLPALQDACSELAPLSDEGLRLLLKTVLGERKQQAAPVELVWTGPSGRLGAPRSTQVVLKELFAKATTSVWMTGYAIDHGEQIFAPLAEAMRTRGVTARFLLHLQYDRRDDKVATQEGAANILINRFFAKNWPWSDVRPEVYFDPRTIQKTAKGYVSMHAKAVVVDEHSALVGSANFTDRGQSRNIEAGALIHDSNFAKQLVTQLQSLIDGGHIQKHGGPQ